MESYNLQETNWKDVKTRDYKIAILPWGATEAHNLHLPYGTDTFLAYDVALRSAKMACEQGVECVVLPAIPFGVNSGQMEIKLCMNIHPSTQKIVLNDIIQVLKKANINKLVIINAHGGNNFQPIIRELSVEHPGFLICTINWWIVCNPNDYFTIPGDHAGEIETSAMMAIKPELVLPLSEAGEGKENKINIKGFNEKWAWIPRRWIYVTDDTGVGNPVHSSADKGEKFINECTNKISSFIVDFSKIEKEKELYLQHE